MTQIEWPRIDAVSLARLRRPRRALALSLLMFNCGSYLGLTWLALYMKALWVIIVIAPIQALILCGIFGVVHDCVHGAFFKSRRANEILGRIAAAVVVTNFSFYKSFHIKHHACATLPEDPEGVISLTSLKDYARFLLAPIFFLNMWIEVLKIASGAQSKVIHQKKFHSAVVWDAVGFACWLIVVCTLTLAVPSAVGFGYLLPLVIFFPLMNLTSLPEHFATVPGRSVIGNTRSTDSNLLFTLLFWFNNLHAEHHAYPSVPSYNLPRLRTVIGHRFRFRERSYIRFHARLMVRLSRLGARQGGR